MSVIATVRVSGDDVALIDALQAAPAVTLEHERTVVDRLERPVHFLWATGGDLDRFEAALPDDPTIEEFEVMTGDDEHRLYRVVVRLEESVSLAKHDRAVSASRISLSVTADGVEREMRFPDRAALSEYVDRVQGEGFEVTLLRVESGVTGRRTEDYGLTDKQRRALEVAFDAGYFSVPRETDLTAVADDLGISRQAASERVRRGIETLLGNTIEETG